LDNRLQKFFRAFSCRGKAYLQAKTLQSNKLGIAATSRDDDKPMPAKARQALEFMRRHGVWHVLSRNSPATGCRDAAARRWRLGKQGIPLYDELKTLCMAADLSGERRHCCSTPALTRG
jgi:hypothetical protein